jgi:aminoglycoside phosphotransferase (APT) family kinase protein
VTDVFPSPLREETIGEYLISRGLIPGTPLWTSTLTDGVSARVYRVDSPTHHWVVKQAMPELRVAATWFADPRRAITEARALKLLGTLTPSMVPQLIDADPETFSLTMTAAPPTWKNWKSVLLGAPDDQQSFASDLKDVAAVLGTTLGTWHRETWGREDVAAEFSDGESFEQLRVIPFHRAIAALYPEFDERIDLLIDTITTRAECLVHGDFSPKNILTGATGIWVLDFEVARFGAAVFDLAFLAHHLAMKALVRPTFASDFSDAFEVFLREYRIALGRELDLTTLGWHSAVLLLSRVDGVSRAQYLSENQRSVARLAAMTVLSSSNGSGTEFWNVIAWCAQEQQS